MPEGKKVGLGAASGVAAVRQGAGGTLRAGQESGG